MACFLVVCFTCVEHKRARCHRPFREKKSLRPKLETKDIWQQKLLDLFVNCTFGPRRRPQVHLHSRPVAPIPAAPQAFHPSHHFFQNPSLINGHNYGHTMVVCGPHAEQTNMTKHTFSTHFSSFRVLARKFLAVRCMLLKLQKKGKRGVSLNFSMNYSLN